MHYARFLVKGHLHSAACKKHMMPSKLPDPRIAERLRQARMAAGFTSAKDAARALNEPDSTYTQHENAKRGFGTEKATRYAMFFKSNLDWLMTGRGPQKGRTSIEELFSALDDERQEQARQYLQFLHSQQNRPR